ncbi:MAG: hypothetical protein OEN23_08905 [Paracoccaceae bacterium]|nr:hypothetical protein [Paracoccaceae bacterium]
MKPILAFALLVFLLAPLAAPAQTLYPMTCGVGGGMRMILSPNGDKTTIQLRFRKARQAARVVRPAPGECAWWDRPLNAREPTLMAIEVKAELWTEFRTVGSGPASAGVVSKRSNLSDQRTANFLLDAVRRGSCFVVNTFNTNRGYFEIVAITEGC